MFLNPCELTHERCPPLSDSEASIAVPLEVQDEIQSEKSEASCFFFDRSNISGTRTDSIAKLETEADALQNQIESIELEKWRIKMEIRGKKQQLIDAIMKVIEFEKEIQSIETLIAGKLHHFQSRIIDLELKRMDIFLNSGDGKVRDLLEREIEEIKEEFDQQSKKDESERDGITQMAQEFTAALGNIIKEYQNYFDEMIEEAEGEKSFHEILEMRNDFNFNMTQLHKLVNRPAQFCNDKTGDRFFLNQNKEKVFKAENHSSEYQLNIEGQRQKTKAGFDLKNDDNGEFYVDVSGLKIYTKYFFEDDFGRFYIDVHCNRVYKTDPEASEYKLLNGKWTKVKEGTYEKDERGLRVKPKTEIEIAKEFFEASPEGKAARAIQDAKDDDLRYIKESVGPAIRKALASVAIHKPVDPINYFANFLLHYRYNQLMFEKREEDLKHFLEIRKEMNEQEKCE